MNDAGNEGLQISRMVRPEESFLQIAQHGGFEVMRVFVKQSDIIWVSPAEDPNLMELYCVLDGSIELMSGEGAQILTKGDCFYTLALQKDVRVRALGNTDLIYVSSAPVYECVKGYQKLLHKMLGPIDAKDHITLEHSHNVMRYTVALFDRLGSRGILMDDIVAASIFHDAGKCEVPDEILKKVGKLTREEYEVMKRHPADSYAVLEPIYGETVARIARSHHERLDGSGYPDGLRGDEIPYGSRLIAVADAFDAMTHKRPYNRVKTPEEAVSELRSLSHQYDPAIVEALQALLSEGKLKAEDTGES